MILGTGATRAVIEPWFLRGRVTALVALLLLCLCVSSWGACETYTGVRYWGASGVCGAGAAVYDIGCANLKCQIAICSQAWTWSTQGGSRYCTYTGNPCSGRLNFTSCDTQVEADSVACERDPSGPNCTTPCTEYQNDCESRGGVWQGSVTSDSTCASTCDLCGTPESQAMREYVYNSCCEGGLTPQYSCGFPGGPSSISGMVYSDVLSMGCNTSNWETQKICDAFYDESSSSQGSSSSTAQSSSSISEYCLLFPNDLACICADNPDHPDCAYLSSNSNSSDSQEPGSSGGGGDTSSDSGGGGSPSSSGSGGVAGDDWEYDYRDSLHRIINATTRTASNTQKVAENTGVIYSILQQAKCLFTDCTDYDQLKMSLDSSINIPDGDTSGVIGSMEAMWDSSAMAEFIRGAEGGDIYGIDGDSVNAALGELGDRFGTALGDTGGVYGEMGKYQEMVEENFPTAQWSYTDACPDALTANVSFEFPAPIGTINSGKNLGGYFCRPLPPFNVTLGNIIRAVIRLALTIAMAMGIFKAATGFNKDG